MTEFKQIIGRGTRVRDDYGKLWFNILDYTGSATRLFADPAFDGEPVRLTEEELSRQGEARVLKQEDEPLDPEESEFEPREPGAGAEVAREHRKLYFDGGQVEIAAHLVYELNPEGKQLRVIRYTDYAGEKVRSFCPTAQELRERWADPSGRAEIISLLEDRGISFEHLAEASEQPEADPFDLLCNLAFNAPLRTRRERAQRLRSERKDFFEQYGPEARVILNELLDKYADHGNAQFVLPDILRVPPVSSHGTISEISASFGGADQLRAAVTDLQNLLYAA